MSRVVRRDQKNRFLWSRNRNVQVFFEDVDGEREDVEPRAARAEDPMASVGLLGMLGSTDDVPSDPRRCLSIRKYPLLKYVNNFALQYAGGWFCFGCSNQDC